jgi:hypothetical protein
MSGKQFDQKQEVAIGEKALIWEGLLPVKISVKTGGSMR